MLILSDYDQNMDVCVYGVWGTHHRLHASLSKPFI